MIVQETNLCYTKAKNQNSTIMAVWPKCLHLPPYTFLTWKIILNYQHSCAVSAKITCRPNFEIRTKTKNTYFESFILHSIFTRLGMTAKVWLLQRIRFNKKPLAHSFCSKVDNKFFNRKFLVDKVLNTNLTAFFNVVSRFKCFLFCLLKSS